MQEQITESNRIENEMFKANAELKFVGVVGNFGGSVPVFDGQRLRTRLVREELKRRLVDHQVLCVDTGGHLIRQPFKIVSIIRLFCQSDLIFIMPGPRGLMTLLPLFLFLRRALRKKVHYLVVGGWLPDFIASRSLMAKGVGKLDGVHVQSRRMVRQLNKLSVHSVAYLPNFRNFTLSSELRKRETRAPIHLVFLSRIIPEKGLDLAVSAVREINRMRSSKVVLLDIYGPLEKRDRSWFKKLNLENDPAIRYHGPIQHHHVIQVLTFYDALIFPTSYDGEGFPGVIVEGYAAGLTVLASDWRDNSEVVKNDVSGLLFAHYDTEAIRRAIERLLDEPGLLDRLRDGARTEAEHYHVDNVIPKLLADIGLPSELNIN